MFAVLAAVVIGGFIAYRHHEDSAKAKAAADKAKQPRAVSVTVAPVTTQNVPLWLEGLGSVSAWQQVTVHSQVDGRLDKVFFKEGQAVKKGEMLAQIDPRPYAVQLHQAEGSLAKDTATLADTKLNLERYRALVQQKLIAQQQVDDQASLVGQAEGAVTTDKAAIESARLNLDYAAVRAPLDGIVGVRLVDAGNLVHATDTTGLVVLTQLDPAAVFVTLPEDDLERVMTAMHKGDVTVEAWSRDGVTRLGVGKLAVVDNQINQATATLRLKCQVPNPQHLLWPNQFVKARLLTETRPNAIVISPAAVQRGPNGSFVYVVKDGKAEQRNVTIALTTADVAVIDKGLTAGEEVVTEGQNQLRPGVTVIAHAATASLDDGTTPKPDGKVHDGAAGSGGGKGHKKPADGVAPTQAPNGGAQ
ncbi:MAG TPA: efflux RND transporter periplasmic adaptor subunit [Polyangia bacterium]|nr:efflux RND transporter periplasmic adaptor subunit [Polyangia bacterium]